MSQKNKTTKVLLIEDDPDDVLLFREMLLKTGETQFEVKHIERLALMSDILSDESFDVIILDLTLSDSQGLETLIEANRYAEGIPIVVLTGLNDEEFAYQALKYGAQDYLAKGQINSGILIRSLRYSIERHQLKNELELSKLREQQLKELTAVERLSRKGESKITADLFGQKSLHELSAAAFREIVTLYEELITLSIEQKVFQVKYNITDKLRSLAEQLTFYNAGPRDVIEIHSVALKNKSADAPPQKVQVNIEESRLLVLELMGYLAANYRLLALKGI